MPIATAVTTTPRNTTDTENTPMPHADLLSKTDSPANDVAPPASSTQLATAATPPLTPHRAAHHAGASSPAMPTAIAVQSRTPRKPTTTTTSSEIPMPAFTPLQPTLAISIARVGSPPAVRETETSPRPATHPGPSPRASQVPSIAEEELAFFFRCDAQGEACVRSRRVIARWLATLSLRDQDALSLYFDPEPWPASIRKHGIDSERGYALVLAHASAYKRWPDVPQRCAHLRQASQQLEAAVDTHGPRVLRHLTRRSEWTFAAALRAYVKARGRAPSVLRPPGMGPKEAP